MVRNADTFAGEFRDPSCAEVDLGALGGVMCPVLLTGGDQSTPFFAKVLARLAEAVDDAEVRTLPGAGYVPHESHPADYTALISEFAAR